MKNALPAAAPIPGAGVLLAGPRPAAGPPSRSASPRWRAFALLVVAYFITIVDATCRS